MTRQRDIFWDAMKGIAIVAVILIHTTSRNTPGGVAWRQFINFPVALFFFMAGYFCHVRESYGAFVARKAKRLLVPLTVASLVYAGLELYFARNSGTGMTINRILEALVSFPTSWGYFVLALFQCMLLAPFLLKCQERWLMRISFAAYLATAAYFYLASTVFLGKWTLSRSVPVIFCTAWLPLFALGLRLQKRRLTLWAPWKRPLLAGVALMAWAALGGIFWYDHATIQLARSQLRLPCILFSLVLAGLLPNLADHYSLHGRIWTFVARLGELSFFVYLWHRLALISLRAVLPQFAEWHFAFVIVFFAVAAQLMPRTLSRRLWWLGM